jgi:outer membrane immunogenic protein
MQKVIAGYLTLSALVSTHAFAADMAVKVAPPSLAATYNWTGWYVGANVGYGWGDPPSDTTVTSLPGFVAAAHSDGLKFGGPVGGVQAGYNWQGSNRWTVGLEADWQASSQTAALHYLDPDNTLTVAAAATTDYKASILWFGTVRGRLGYAWDRLFVYATGGLAYGDVRLSGTENNSGSFLTLGPPIPFSAASAFDVSQTRAGWTLGGGVEGVLIDNWSWKAEYLYIDLGAVNAAFAGPFTGETIALHTKLTDNIIRAGLNLRLGP